MPFFDQCVVDGQDHGRAGVRFFAEGQLAQQEGEECLRDGPAENGKVAKTDEQPTAESASPDTENIEPVWVN